MHDSLDHEIGEDMGIFRKQGNAQAQQAVEAEPVLPDFGVGYLRGILEAARVPPTDVNMFNLAQRTAMALGLQGAAYTAQAGDRASFDRFVQRFSEPPADWLNVSNEIAAWLWNWSSFCHHALAAQAHKWATGCLQPGGFVSSQGVEPWENGTNRSPADNLAMWQAVFARNWRS